MIDRIWRYSINMGETGGIVIADSKEDAEREIKKYHEKDIFNLNKDELLIWKWHDDDYYDSKNPFVLNCY